MFRPSLFVGAFLALALAGCGGSGGGGSSATKSVTIKSSSTTAKPGTTLAFTAIVKGGGKVVWSVDGGDASGTITTTGVYTAPTTQGVYTVRATSGEITATKTVTVTNGITIALTSSTDLPLTIPRSKLNFSAAVGGTSDKAIVWSVTGAAGAIAADGTFTAPNTPGTYTVVATSHADTSKSVSTTVTVVANVNIRLKWVGKADVVISLRPDKAPNTCANYVTLVNKFFYNGIKVHRWEDGFVVQWGDPLSKTLPLDDPNMGTGGPGYTIPFEVNDLSNVHYSVAMARSSGADTAGSQIYVNLADNTSLDHTDTNQGYVVFGAIASGQSVVDALRVGDILVTASTEAVP